MRHPKEDSKESAHLAPAPFLSYVLYNSDELICEVDLEMRYVLVNPAYRAEMERLYGKTAVAGDSLIDLVCGVPGDIERARRLFERAFAGETFTHVEEFGDPRFGGSHCELRLYPLRDTAGAVSGAALIVSNLTERRRRQDQQRFLVDFERALRVIEQAEIIGRTATRLLGEFLDVERCAYVEVEPDEVTFQITGEFARGVRNVAGRFELHAFGALARETLQRRETYVVDDVEADPRLLPRDRDAHRALEIGAVVCVPLQRNGLFIAAMAVHAREPRRWRFDEIELLTLVANRCWESIERAKAEGALRQSNERFRILSEGASQIIWTADENGRVIEDSPSWRGFTGQTLEQWRGLGGLSVVHPDDREALRHLWIEAVRRGEPLHTEARMRRADGVWRWVEIRSHPLRGPGGTIREWVGVNTDVTERKHRERRDAFLVLLDDSTRSLAAPAAICEIVLRLLRDHLRASWACFLEFSAEWCHEEARDVTGGVLPAPIQRLEDWGGAGAAAIRAGQAYALPSLDDAQLDAATRAHLRAGGTAALLLVPLLRDAQAGAIIAIGQAHPRRWQPEEVELTRAVVNRLWESLARARVSGELADADRRKDEFLATLAHELRNPLAPLRNALSVLQHAPELPPARLHAMMDRQVNQLVRLVDDLLDVSRITRGKIELQSSLLKLSEVLAVAIETARPLIEAGEHTFVCEAVPPALTVQGDSVRLTQIFANLLNNAAKFTEPGGRITLSAQAEGAQAVVRVLDTGLGIDPSMRERVFEIFAQVSPASPKPRGGLGIGLSLVKRLAILHGGSVEVHSAGVGHGSEFIVRLPLAEMLPAQPVPADPAPLREATRVLVVDDNRDAADSMAAFLQMLGVDAYAVYDGASALAELDRYRPTLAFLDIGMPEMDGYELARRIRAHARGIRLVALTGWGQAGDRRRTQEAGFDHHLVKPVDIDLLQAVLAGQAPAT